MDEIKLPKEVETILSSMHITAETEYGGSSYLPNDMDAVYLSKIKGNGFEFSLCHDNTVEGIWRNFTFGVFEPLDAMDKKQEGRYIEQKALHEKWEIAKSFKEALKKEIENNPKLLFQKEVKEYSLAGKEITADSVYNTRFSNNWRFADWDSFMNFMDGGSVETYWRIAKKCKEHGITHVYDIGCNCGWQAKIFRFMGIKYTGVEAERASLDIAPKGKGIDYIARPYPFEIHVDDKEHTAAVSNLCLGYLFLDKQKETYDRLAEDFKYFCGSLGPDEMNYFSALYGMSEAEKGFIFWGDRSRVNEREGYEKVRKEQDALFNGRMVQPKTADLTPDFTPSEKRLKK